MLAEELRKKSLDDLKAMILANKKELMNLRFQKSGGQLANPGRIKELRREVARIKTIMHAEHAQKPVKE